MAYQALSIDISISIKQYLPNLYITELCYIYNGVSSEHIHE